MNAHVFSKLSLMPYSDLGVLFIRGNRPFLEPLALLCFAVYVSFKKISILASVQQQP